MNDPFVRILPLNDPVFAPLHREDLPSFVVGLPKGDVVAATPACTRLGLAPDTPLPGPAADAARRIAARDDDTAAQERIFLPLASEPQLFSCRAILTPAGQFVMFADPRSLSTPAAGDAAVSTGPHGFPDPVARPVRFTWEVDADGRLTQLSQPFCTSFPVAGWQGRPFLVVLAELGFAGGATLAAAQDAQASFADIALEGPAGRISLGGVVRFTPDQVRAGARGFGQIWLTVSQPARDNVGAVEAVKPDVFPPPPAETAAPDAPHGDNVVPLRAGNLSPRERTAFHEIARTLHDAIDSWQKTGDAPLPPEPEDAPSPGPEANQTEGEDGVLDRLPLGVVVHQHGELVRVNRTLLSWCGDADMEAFEAAGGLTPRLSRPDAVKPLSLRTNAGTDLPVEVRVVSAAWAGRPALVHVVRRLDDGQAPAHGDDTASTALQETLDLIPAGIVLLDRSGAIEESNETLVRYAGFPRADLRGEPFTILFAPHNKSRAVLLLDEAASQTAPLPCTALLTVRGRKGADVAMVATLARVETDAQRYCLVLRPAGEGEAAAPVPAPLPRNIPADALEAPQARAAVDALARRMSLAIRTPLTTILGFVDAVRSSTFGPVGNARYSKHAEAAQMAGQQLLALLEDVEHLFPAAPVAEPDRVDLSTVLASALGHLEDMTKRRRILVRRDVPEALTCAARPAALDLMVRLLLEEALRATPLGGQVMVSIRRDGERVALRVRDAGAPLSEVEIAQALDALATAPVGDRFSTAGRPFRFARLSALVRAEGGILALQRGTSGGLLVDLSFPA